jgi:hypothetical protein
MAAHIGFTLSVQTIGLGKQLQSICLVLSQHYTLYALQQPKIHETDFMHTRNKALYT